MTVLFSKTRIACVVIVLSTSAASVRADIVTLKNGGEIRGVIQKAERGPKSSRREIVVQTLGGAFVTIERLEVESVKHRSPVYEEYETRRRTAADTVDGQWELSEWCRQRNLRKQRRIHLQRIVELDSEHLLARRGLGHRQYDGQWMSRDEYMQSQGQVLYRGKYVFPQELAQILKGREDKKEQRVWHKKIKMWHTWLTGDRVERRQKARKELTSITDPNAIPALSKRFRDDRDKRLRKLYVSILSGIKGGEVLEALLYQLLYDKHVEVRRAATAAIGPDLLGRAVAALIRGLKSEQNFVVGRAATALAQIGDEQVVPQLIDALITTHKYRVVVPDRGSTNVSFNSNGSGFGPTSGSGLPPNVEVMLLTGQLPHGVVVIPPEPSGRGVRKKVKLVKRKHRNKSVLEALKHLTEKDFAFNQRSWRLWWTEKMNTVGKS